MARRKLSDINDGIIEGHIDPRGGACHNCGVHTRVIVLHALNLPKEFYDLDMPFPDQPGIAIPVAKKDLFKRLVLCDDQGSMIQAIGIGCGCYAKGHRQIAHIKDRMK